MKKEKINIKELINRFIPTVKKIIEYIKKVEFKSKMKLIGEIIVIILILCLLKLPFSIVRDLIISAFFSVKISSELLMDAIYLLFGVPYFLLAVYLFIKTIVTRYENIEVIKNIDNKNENLEAQEESRISNISNTSNTSNTSPVVNTDNTVITSNSAIEESKEVANIPLQSIEPIPNTNLENQVPINNEQENNIDNS